MEQFDWSLTTNFNARTFLANPRTEIFFALCAAHFVLGLIHFYSTPLQPVFFCEICRSGFISASIQSEIFAKLL